MGIIKAAVRSISGGLADQWLEVIEAGGMSDSTVFAPGVLTRRGENVKGTAEKSWTTRLRRAIIR